MEDLRPSKSHRWLECTQSPYLEGAIKDKPPSKYAIDGTFAHAIGEHILTKKIKPSKIHKLVDKDFKFEYESIGEIIKETRVIDIETLQCVKQYIEFVYKKTKYKNIKVEKKVKARKGIEGTADCYFVKCTTLYVIDYKHGAGVDVKIENNSQLLIYALGAYKRTKKPIDKIKLVIVQPRTTGIKEQVITKKQLMQFKKLLERRHYLILNNPTCKVGPWCKWCKAETTCLENFLNFKKTVDMRELTIGSKEYSEVLKLIPQVESYIKAIKQESFEIATDGVKIPGYKLVNKRERTSLKYDSEKTIRRLTKKGFKESLLINVKLKSITDLKKIVPNDTMNKLVTKQSSGLELVPESDKREAVTDVKAQFADGVEG